MTNFALKLRTSVQQRAPQENEEMTDEEKTFAYVSEELIARGYTRGWCKSTQERQQIQFFTERKQFLTELLTNT